MGAIRYFLYSSMLLKVSEPFDSAKNERWQEDQKSNQQVGPHAKPPWFELGQNKNGLGIPMLPHTKAGGQYAVVQGRRQSTACPNSDLR
jgi:hypothetical protein